MKVTVIPVTPFQQNCSLISDPSTGNAAIIDPGGDEQLIIEQVTKAGVQIEKILLTHGHLDHVGATQALKAHYNVPVIGPHKDEQFWFDWLPKQCGMFGFPHIDAFLPDHWLQHGEQVRVGSLILEARLCPGHTPGHVVFYEAQSQQVIVGDVLFAGSIGRTDFPRGNHSALLNSINEQLLTLPDEVTVFPGHGPTTTIGHEKRHNPFVSSGKFG